MMILKKLGCISLFRSGDLVSDISKISDTFQDIYLSDTLEVSDRCEIMKCAQKLESEVELEFFVRD